MIDRRRFLRLFAGAGLWAAAPRMPGAAAGQAERDAVTAAATSPTSANAVTLFLCGDVMTGRGIDQILPHPADPRLYEPAVRDARDYVALAEEANGPIPRPVDFDYIWGDALAEFARMAPDLRIINLETAITDRGRPAPKGINYRMAPANVGCLSAAGIDCCNLANNHVLDWGRQGLADTLATLDQLGIRHAGAGRDLAAASAPAVLTVPGKGRVLVFGLGSVYSGIGHDWAATADRPGVDLLPGLSPATARTVAAQVQAVKQPGDLAVASIHWGGNWGYQIPAEQRAFAHALIDSGQVDLVHGHSSHHVKGIEVYQGRLILYGCGDFLTDYEGISGNEAYRDDLGLMYFPRLEATSGRLLELTMTPTRIRRMRIQRASKAETRWLADVLDREGHGLGTGAGLDGEGRLALRW